LSGNTSSSHLGLLSYHSIHRGIAGLDLDQTANCLDDFDKPVSRKRHGTFKPCSFAPWIFADQTTNGQVLSVCDLVAPVQFRFMFLGYWLVLATATSHAGFENLVLGDKAHLKVGSFHHQLHHRYFECNYGNAEMPWDNWFGSYHDGSHEATERVRETKKRMYANIQREGKNN